MRPRDNPQIVRTGIGNPIVPESTRGSGSDPERAAGVAVFTMLVEIQFTDRAAQHFTETPGLDAGASAEWAGFELHGFSFAGRHAQFERVGLSYRCGFSTDRSNPATSVGTATGRGALR